MIKRFFSGLFRNIQTIRHAPLAVFFFSIILLSVFPAKQAGSWGAFRGVGGSLIANTHQRILAEAFALLLKDPVMRNPSALRQPDGSKLSIFDLMQHEGVEADVLQTVMSLSINIIGPGPDADGASPYSWHYYNPATGKGNANVVAGKFYWDYLQFILGNSLIQAEGIKGLTWASHFVADMFVPYHLNGIPAEEALYLANNGNYYLNALQSGPLFMFNRKLSLQLPNESFINIMTESIWGYNGNFQGTYKAFLQSHGEANQFGRSNPIDWFDPWYWNGYFFKVPFSSHASWESFAHDQWMALGGRYYDKNPGITYDQLWQNAYPDYNFTGFYLTSQARQVEKFAGDIASRSKRNLQENYMNPADCIQETIKAVYTVLRSTTSALYPTVLNAYPDPDPSRKGNLIVEMNLVNFAPENCEDIGVKFSAVNIEGGSFQQISPTRLSAGGFGQETITKWSAPLDPTKLWNIYLEVTGSYKQTPDLQYAQCFYSYYPNMADLAQGNLPADYGQGVFGASTWTPGSLTGNIYFLNPGTAELPNFDTLSLQGQIYATKLDIPETMFDSGFPGVTNRFEWFAIRYNGQINIKIPGNYQFKLTSDDGSRLIIDRNMVINNDGLHRTNAASGSIKLEAGIYPIIIDYFQGPRYHVALQFEVVMPNSGRWEIFDMRNF